MFSDRLLYLKTQYVILVEKAEATCYNMLIEKLKVLNMGTEAVSIPERNLQEEQSMIDG